MNQHFSFRDLFKYSYLKQTEIDNENIMQEHEWEHDVKRKATFEIIFRIYDKLLQDYKATLATKNIEKKELDIRIQGIKDFLQATEITSAEDVAKSSLELSKELERLKTELSRIKQTRAESDASRILQRRVLELREKLRVVKNHIVEQSEYRNKLTLLYNQYQSEINKQQLAIDGYFVFDQYEYILCPNCL